jgi:hypothetical protein
MYIFESSFSSLSEELLVEVGVGNLRHRVQELI